MHRQHTIEKLKQDLQPRRFLHTLGVEEAALSLARRTGVNPEQASEAALLHDCAKHMDMKAMQAALLDSQMQADPFMQCPALLHGPAGAARAKEVYQVQDAEVLDAIWWHTTGKPGLSKLGAVLYLADYIEPHRGTWPGLEDIRQAVQRDLHQGLVMAARAKLEYVKQGGKTPHPLSEEMLSWLEGGGNPFSD